MLRNSIQKSIGSKLHENRMSAMTDAIDHSLPQNKYISKIFATPSAYPVQILDIRGREASGLIICLMLMLLGVDREHILRDYMQSSEELIAVRDEMLQKLRGKWAGSIKSVEYPGHCDKTVWDDGPSPPRSCP